MSKSLSKSRFIEMFGNVATNNKRWEKTKLGNKSVIGSSKRIFANEYTTEGIPFYRSKEIIELGMGEKPSVELYISKKRYQEIKEKFGIPIPGDILMTAVGTIGKFWIVPNSKPFYYKDGNLVYIRTKEFNPLFLKKLLEMLIEKYKVENANGSAYTALTIEKLKDLQIVLPPMTLQKQYEEFYIQIDKSKFILQKMIEKLELLKKSRFVEMYSQIESEEEKLSDICDVRDGTHDSPKYVTDGYPLITSKNVTSGSIDFSTANLISKEDFDAINKRSKVNINDIIMPMIGTIGFPVIVETNKGFAIKNVALIRTSECNRMLPEFLCSFFNSSFFEKQLAKISRGGTQKFISLGNIRDLMVKVPSLEVQKQFCNYVRQLDKLKLILQKQLDDLVGETK